MQFLILPLLQLYLQYKIANYIFRFIILGLVFTLYKNTLNFVMNYFLNKLQALDFPCMVAYIVNELQILTMIEYGLSIFITIATGRFMLKMLMRFV